MCVCQWAMAEQYVNSLRSTFNRYCAFFHLPAQLSNNSHYTCAGVSSQPGLQCGRGSTFLSTSLPKAHAARQRPHRVRALTGHAMQRIIFAIDMNFTPQRRRCYNFHTTEAQVLRIAVRWGVFSHLGKEAWSTIADWLASAA